MVRRRPARRVRSEPNGTCSPIRRYQLRARALNEAYQRRFRLPDGLAAEHARLGEQNSDPVLAVEGEVIVG
ncbi:MAG: hypothetical protein ACXIUM_08600 [Wenzhouxiangella sp.]